MLSRLNCLDLKLQRKFNTTVGTIKEEAIMANSDQCDKFLKNTNMRVERIETPRTPERRYIVPKRNKHPLLKPYILSYNTKVKKKTKKVLDPAKMQRRDQIHRRSKHPRCSFLHLFHPIKVTITNSDHKLHRNAKLRVGQTRVP